MKPMRATAGIFAITAIFITGPVLAAGISTPKFSKTDLTSRHQPCPDGEFRVVGKGCRVSSRATDATRLKADPQRNPFYYQGSAKSRHRGPLYNEPRLRRPDALPQP